LGVEIEVASTNDEAWSWRKVKRKSDRDDGLKLAKLKAQNNITPVYMPKLEVRQWRALIQYRHRLVGESTGIRNRIRALLDQVALALPARSKAFSVEGRAQWRAELCRDLHHCPPDQLWRGMVDLELKRLEELEKHLEVVDMKLDEIARADQRVMALQKVPGVGQRTAEVVVATIDDPKRFRRGKQVGNYAGMTPKKYQSGSMDRDGRISRGGKGTLRAMLVQACWNAVGRHVPWFAAVYERARRGSKKRRKQAIIAVARRLLIRLWAMLRDGGGWKEPAMAT
jgi:transposase